MPILILPLFCLFTECVLPCLPAMMTKMTRQSVSGIMTSEELKELLLETNDDDDLDSPKEEDDCV